MPPDARGVHAAIAFTGHAFLLTDVAPASLAPFQPDGFGGATAPDLLLHLAGPGGLVGSLDVVLVARAGGADPLALTDGLIDHPRVERATHHRRDVQVFGDERGFVTVGLGLVGRTEISIELTGAAMGGGSGRELIRGGLASIAEHHGPNGPVFAQVAPGNALSLRSFLACGFVPIGSEVLIERAS